MYEQEDIPIKTHLDYYAVVPLSSLLLGYSVRNRSQSLGFVTKAFLNPNLRATHRPAHWLQVHVDQ